MKKEQQTDSESPEVIDLEWLEVQEMAQMKTTLSELEHQLAAMCVNFEKTKHAFLREIENAEKDINSSARELLKQKEADESVTYELKLPTSPGEKGYFIRK
jgi:hypothetical protein